MGNRVMVLGIDGGGSETIGWSVDRLGSVVAKAKTASADISALGEMGLRDRLMEMRSRLLGEMKTTDNLVRAVALGLPLYGEGLALTQRLEDAAKQVFPEPLVILNDVRMGLEAAFSGGSGIVIGAGTGSMAWAKTSDGRERRCGGWSHVFSDEGSAYFIGVEALRSASQMMDGRLPRTPLMEALLNSMGVHDFGEAGEWSFENRRKRIASLAVVVDAVAMDGDEVAYRILSEAGNELARLAISLKVQLFPEEVPPVARYGGVFQSRIVRDSVDEALQRVGMGIAVPAILTPVAGACLVAARRAGWAESCVIEGLMRESAGPVTGNSTTG